MNAIVPLSQHGAAATADAGNNIGMAPVPVFTQIADVAERMRCIHAAMRRVKGSVGDIEAMITAGLSELLPGIAYAGFAKHVLIPQINFTISNVRGPDTPRLLAGAHLHMFAPINLLLDGLGLSLTGFSYNVNLWFCAVADRDMLPDPQSFADGMRDSIAEHFALSARRA